MSLGLAALGIVQTLVFAACTGGGSLSLHAGDDPTLSTPAPPITGLTPYETHPKTAEVRRIFEPVRGFAFSDVGLSRRVAGSQVDLLEAALGDIGHVVDSVVKIAKTVGVSILVTGAMIQPAPGHSTDDALQAIVDRVDDFARVKAVGNGRVLRVRRHDTVIALTALERATPCDRRRPWCRMEF